jgi:hypothetical protein
VQPSGDEEQTMQGVASATEQVQGPTDVSQRRLSISDPTASEINRIATGPAMRLPSDESTASLGRRKNIQFDPASVRPSSRDMRARRRSSQEHGACHVNETHGKQEDAYEVDAGAAAVRDKSAAHEPDGASTQVIASASVSRSQSGEYLVATSSGASAGYLGSDEFKETDQIDFVKDMGTLQIIREQSEDLSSHDHGSEYSFVSPSRAGRRANAEVPVLEIESFVQAIVDSMYVEARAQVIALEDDKDGHEPSPQWPSRVESVTEAMSDIPETDQSEIEPESSFERHYEVFYESEDAEVLQLSPVIETPRSDGILFAFALHARAHSACLLMLVCVLAHVHAARDRNAFLRGVLMFVLNASTCINAYMSLHSGL